MWNRNLRTDSRLGGSQPELIHSLTKYLALCQVPGGKNTQKNYRKKKNVHDPENHNGVITHLRSGHPGMQSQVGLKHHYEQS